MQRLGRFALIVFELTFLSASILATRCANYQDVFVAGNIYFADADCYARMTRAQMCRAKPGLIVRHHEFENFPQGTTPHTTAPLDYLIVALSLLLKPFTAHALDFAGAFVSPLLALLGGWFLWWWSRRMKFRYRWVMLILYAISPMLVHGTELGRPDHQSLLIPLIAIAICADWNFQQLQPAHPPSDAIRESRIAWSLRALAMTRAVAWAVAIWVSAYEPLILFLIVNGTTFLANPRALFRRDRRAGWILFLLIIVAALLIERRVPSFGILESYPIFKNWAGTIGELAHVSPANPVWLRWCGFLLLVAPFLIWMNIRTRRDGGRSGLSRPTSLCCFCSPRYFLTIWQARWGYFFVLIFALALPALLAPIKSRAAVWIAFVLSIFPILRDWDERLWPNEAQLAARWNDGLNRRRLRDLALSLRSPDVHPFLAPWWLSPSIAYWSGQPGVAGSSHESLNGIEETARDFFFRRICKKRAKFFRTTEWRGFSRTIPTAWRKIPQPS